MCSTKAKSAHPNHNPIAVAQIDGRRVLQPACNRVIPNVESPLKKKNIPAKSPSFPVTKPSVTQHKVSPPISPKSTPAIKRGNDPSGLYSSVDKPPTPKSAPKSTPLLKKKLRECNSSISLSHDSLPNYSASLIVEAPGSIAAARREHMTLVQAQRKMKIAHYGRTKKKGEELGIPVDSPANNSGASNLEEKRCSFVTPNSDPLYIAYHDEEWGVHVHDDKMLFELLVLTGAQVGLDWTSILKKRKDFRTAFAGFDVEIVANFTEKQIASISTNYGMELSRVRGAVDNANRILQVKREYGSFDEYLWAFVNYKPMITQYRSCRKIPAKTSKSETISKDLVRRGFRNVGPTVMHSFMQAAGLTNDHLLTCPRHHQCAELAADGRPTAAPAV